MRRARGRLVAIAAGLGIAVLALRLEERLMGILIGACVGIAIGAARMPWGRARRARTAVDQGARDATASRVRALRRNGEPVPPGEPRP